jgi:hypothetical protein
MMVAMQLLAKEVGERQRHFLPTPRLVGSIQNGSGVGEAGTSSAVRFAQRRPVSAAGECRSQPVSVMVFANTDEALAHDLWFALTFKVGKRRRPLDDQERRIHRQVCEIRELEF